MAIGLQLSDKNADGTALGQAATDKIAFFGATPVDQPSSTLFAVTTAYTPINTGGYGFTSTQCIRIQAQLNALIDACVELGIVGIV